VSSGTVIGATGGIGGACARRLAGSTDVLVLSGRREEPLAELARELGPGAVAVAADIATAAGRDAILGAVREPLAWVVLAHGMPLRRPLTEASESEIVDVFETNLVAPTLLVRRLLDLRWKESAALVVVGSISASRALPRRALYGATKAGLEHLARSLAAELAPSGIRVNVVSPGVIDTPFLGEGTSSLEEWVSERVPVGRLGGVDEVADVVRYVALEGPPYLTGARIAVDGGAEAVA
jgi:NAD(P)-dependent dehydrogenase (short-subunit alcohol dehydrogenase family)